MPPPPAQLCDSAPVDGRAPRLDPALGKPTAVGRAAGATALHAYGWATSVPMVAEAILDQAVAEAPDCEYREAGDPAAGVVRSAAPWSGSGWTGVTITEAPGGRSAFRETRLLRSEEVVLLVVLTVESGSPQRASMLLDGYLAAVAERLG